MTAFVVTLILLVLRVIACGQSAPGQSSVYKFSEQILEDLDKTNPQYAKAAHEFSFIGDYKNALIFDGRMRQPYGDIKKSDSLFFKKFHPTNAAEYIIRRAEHEQIIIINEAHHFPYHRVFIASLLEGLYDKGFRYYGAETLNFSDSAINKRKYPTLNSGFYTAEPQFGNLLRDALRLGFTVFPYEARTVDALQDPKRREQEQANNIREILLQHPSAKILIHAGYDHIREDSLGGTWEKAMAARLREITGIDPFTINQEVMTERAHPALENPFYKMTSVDKPTIFVDDSGNIFAGPAGTHYYDVRLCHPRTKYIENRPHWLLSHGKKYVYLNQADLFKNVPCLIQAYHPEDDPSVAIPVDVIEVVPGVEDRPLVLKPGKYRVHVKAMNGKEKHVLVQVNRDHKMESR